MWQNDPFNSKYISNENEKYFTYSQGHGTYAAIRLSPNGKVVAKPQGDELVHCDLYKEDPQSGCAEHSLVKCMGENTFSSRNANHDFINSKSSTKEYEAHLSLIDCEVNCRQDCFCYGYASLNENGTGCEFWDENTAASIVAFGEGLKLIYVRTVPIMWWKNYWTWLVAAVSGICLLVLCLLVLKKRCGDKVKQEEAVNVMLGELAGTTTHSGIQMLENETSRRKTQNLSQVYQFRFETIEMATNNFSDENKLGEGGFGLVYKGKLFYGQEIAVKRLSRSSRQGIVEFKNEIQLIAKLQHNNLVRLLGCCIHQEEMILVYEYMPNKSLDSFLFDPVKQELLKWTDRMNIIEGIAQGILYLHKHSRLKVIHRDLKAGNILLDLNMTPKISDFGTARIFGMQDSENTKKIVGTHGDMSPEYAIKGVISTKTDVFSFGVLVLEIVSGKKNHRSYHSERPLNLIGLAWELWVEGRALDFVDRKMDVLKHKNEVTKCINIGLLCVQDHAAERPSMADVIVMIKNDSLQLPTPNQPAFFIDTTVTDKEDIEEDQENICSNKLSTSIMEAR